MEPKIVITTVFAVLAVVGLVGLLILLTKGKTKTANVFGLVGLVSSIGDIVMGAIIHTWWVWVLAIIFVIASLFFLLANNLDDGPYPVPGYYDE